MEGKVGERRRKEGRRREGGREEEGRGDQVSKQEGVSSAS